MISQSSKAKGSVIQALDRGLQLIELISQASTPVPLAQLARELHVNRSTAHRLLGTLVAHGYIRQDPVTKHYSLGLKLLELGRHVIDDLDLYALARPFLKALVQESGEGVSLVSLSGTQGICLDHEPSSAALAVTTNIGSCFPLHATAAGKILLVGLPPEQSQELLEPSSLIPYTPHTITHVPALMRHINLARERGYAVDDEERYQGVRSVACAVYDHHQQVVSALSLGGPSVRVSLDRIPTLAAAVGRTAAQISEALGCKSYPQLVCSERISVDDMAPSAGESSHPRLIAAF